MNQEQFLKELHQTLDMLTESAWEEEKQKYISKIEIQKQNGKTEEEAVKSLENINEIKESILLERGINPKKLKKRKSFIYREFRLSVN